MVADTQLHKLSLIIFDFSTYKRTVTNFRPVEKPDNYSINDILNIILSSVG